MAFYEIRQYEIRPGKMAEWLKLFNEVVLPFQMSKGMVVPGVFSGEADDTMFFWMRRFDDEAHRVKLYAAVYESPEWKNDISPLVGECIDRSTIISNRVVPAAMSILQ